MNRLENTEPVISTQVLNEVCNVLIRKFKKGEAEVRERIEDLAEQWECRLVGVPHILDALRIKFRYGFSYFDSLMLASGLEAQCPVLLTEDLQHNQRIDEKLLIVNPFREDSATG